MTIAAAMMCTDGFVICADTEHTGTGAKFQKKKILEFVQEDGSSLVVVGAGATAYIDMVIDSLEEGFEKCDKTFASINGLIKRSVREVYRDHITPHWPGSDPNGPQIFMIVGTRLPDGSVRVWKISETSVSRCRHSAFVGIGADVANGLATWLYPAPGLERLAIVQIIAKEILTETKRVVPECGGRTHVCTMPTGTKGGRVTNLRKRDDGEFFWGINSIIANLLYATIDKQHDDKAFQVAVDRLTQYLADIRKETKKLSDGEEWQMMLSTFMP